MVNKIGPTFGQELIAAGCIEGIVWTQDGVISSMTPAQEAVLAAHDPTKVAVPSSVTRLQGRLQLSAAGLLTQAEAAVTAAGGTLPIWYADAATWQRIDPHVVALGTALNLTPAQIDALFIAAAQITG